MTDSGPAAAPVPLVPRSVVRQMGLMLLLVGVAVVGLFGGMRYLTHAVGYMFLFETVPARVVQSGVRPALERSVAETVLEQALVSLLGWRPSRDAVPQVTFVYHWGGRLFESTHLALQSSPGGRDEVLAWVERHFPVNAEVTARVDTAHPEQAYLILDAGVYPPGVTLGGMLMLAGALILFLGRRDDPCDMA
ncbi:MAG: hypothetical protein H7831_07705 [Magnetococcus sp. WYHC-3]